MEVYISGKIGKEVIDEDTRQKFLRAEKMLREHGYEVFNPTDPRWQSVLEEGYHSQYFEPGGLPANAVPFYSYVLLRDMMALSRKDAIYMLDDWCDSPGARAELAFARAVGMLVMSGTDLKPWKDGHPVHIAV